MATNYVQPGDVIEYTAGADISSGDVVVVGDNVGIALTDIANGATGSVQIAGVFTVPKTSGTAWNQGDRVDYDVSAGEFHKGLTAASGDVENCGIAFAAAASGDTTANVLLTPGTGTLN